MVARVVLSPLSSLWSGRSCAPVHPVRPVVLSSLDGLLDGDAAPAIQTGLTAAMSGASHAGTATCARAEAWARREFARNAGPPGDTGLRAAERSVRLSRRPLVARIGGSALRRLQWGPSARQRSAHPWDAHPAVPLGVGEGDPAPPELSHLTV
jgi:hypothetical protein